MVLILISLMIYGAEHFFHVPIDHVGVLCPLPVLKSDCLLFKIIELYEFLSIWMLTPYWNMLCKKAPMDAF